MSIFIQHYQNNAEQLSLELDEFAMHTPSNIKPKQHDIAIFDQIVLAL
jgi:hypothetical protein